MKKLLAVFLAAVLAVGTIAGCSSAPAGENGGDKPAENGGTAATEQVLNINFAVNPADWDPCNEVNNTSTQMYAQMYSNLYRLTEEGEQPSLATSYDVSEDGLTYTFHLQEGLKFSDGSPLTAKDFEYTWKRAMDPKVANEYAWILCDFIKGGYAFNGLVPDDYATTEEYDAAWQAARDAVGVKATDDKTLTVTLETPAPYFLNVVCMSPFSVLSQAFIEGLDDYTKYGRTLETTLFSGAFMISEWEDSSKLTLVKNPNYFEADKVKLEQINISFVADASTELLMFDTGELDMTYNAMSNADALSYADSEEFHIWETLANGWATFNVEAFPLDDVKVRKALVMAIDFETIAQTVIGGGAKAATGFVPSAMPNPADPSKQWRDDALQSTKADPEGAKKLLQEAGWAQGSDNKWTKDGKEFPSIRMNYNTKTTMDGNIANAMIGYWAAIGIPGELEPMESALRSTIRPAGEFMVTWQGWTSDYADAFSFLDCMRSDHAYNYGRFKNEEFDKLMVTAKTSLDQKERYDAMIKAENILFEEMPNINFMFSTKPYLEKSYVKGVMHPSLGTMDFTYAYIEGK